MDKTIRANSLAKAIIAANERAQYDIEAKKLLSYVDILAPVLQGSIKALHQYDLEEIKNGISPKILVDQVDIELENTNRPKRIENSDKQKSKQRNPRVQELNTVLSEIGEGSILLDVFFEVNVRDFHAIINIEIQKCDPSNYFIKHRMENHGARILTSQKDRKYTSDHYSDALDVYTIC